MNAAELGIAAEVEIFRHQVGVTGKVVKLNLENISHEESLIQPEGGMNCINWVVGHLVCIYNNVLPMLGQEQVFETEAIKRYARGSKPLREAAEALELQRLIAAWDEASKRIDAGLANLTPEALNGPAPFSPGNDPKETISSLLSLVCFHQAYHAGQLGILRRAVGKQGAIG